MRLEVEEFALYHIFRFVANYVHDFFTAVYRTCFRSDGVIYFWRILAMVFARQEFRVSKIYSVCTAKSGAMERLGTFPVFLRLVILRYYFVRILRMYSI